MRTRPATPGKRPRQPVLRLTGIVVQTLRQSGVNRPFEPWNEDLHVPTLGTGQVSGFVRRASAGPPALARRANPELCRYSVESLDSGAPVGSIHPDHQPPR